MDKDNKQNQARITDKQTFPNLKRTYSVSKNFIALSKVEIDKNVATMQQPNSNIRARQIITSYSHKRIISGMNIKQFAQSQSQMSKTYRNFGESVHQKNKLDFNKQISASIGNINNQPQLKEKNQKALPLIQKSKVSTKAIGVVKGYSVNSHPGSLNTANQDRICLITNLNKSIIKDQQISFFSIYDGNNGVAKAQFFRDNFHTALVKDKNLLQKDVQNAIKKAFITVEQSFIKNNSELQNLPTTKFLMVIIIDNQAFIASMGQNKMIFSRNQGKQIINPLIIKQPKRKLSRPKIHRSQPLNVTINILKMQIKQLDFIVLGSEGLFQNFSQVCIGKKFWKQFLQKTNRGFHTALGQSTNSIMNEVFQQISTKNVSLILIAFQNTQICFGENANLELPYVSENYTLNIEQI